MSLAVLNSRIKKMECENKPIPQKYIDCFNDYIKKIINIRVDQEVEYLNDIIADKFELGKFKSVNELIYAYKSLEKEYTKSRQQIAELEEQLKNAIMPKFNRQEHIYCIAFGEIREFIVVAYLDNNITLCEDTTTSRLEWCDNNFLVLTKKEAEAKLRELQGEKR